MAYDTGDGSITSWHTVHAEEPFNLLDGDLRQGQQSLLDSRNNGQGRRRHGLSGRISQSEPNVKGDGLLNQID